MKDVFFQFSFVSMVDWVSMKEVFRIKSQSLDI